MRTRLILEALEERCVLSVSDFRPVDEVGNNLTDPLLGTANTDLLRLSPVAYSDGISKPSMGGKAPTFIPSPREVSNIVANQNPILFGSPTTDINTVNDKGLSGFSFVLGQFIDHDLDLSPDGAGVFNIPVDPNHPEDPIGSLAFTRSQFDPNTGTDVTNPRRQINVNTAFLDLSQVYGSTQVVADALRTFSGGLLKTSPGNMLPYNNLTYFTQDQLNALNMANDAGVVPSDQLFAAGDVRANESTQLTAMQTLFMRNHNKLAGELQNLHPDWDDEQLYQEARKLNIAEEQMIVYQDYLPSLLGHNTISPYHGYDSTVDPSIATEFSTIGFRFGHSLLSNTVARDDNTGTPIADPVGTVQLIESFFNPNLLNPNGVIDPLTGHISTDIDPYLKGAADETAQAMDIFAVSSIRSLLFGNGVPGGEDLISRDIWRAHDHGIGTYNQVRIALGLDPITDDATHGFDQITSDPNVQALLEQAYATMLFQNGVPTGLNAGDIDPFIAGIAEDHIQNSDMGPLFTAILKNQFERIRDGDRYFFSNEDFNHEEIKLLLDGNTLARVIQSNTGIPDRDLQQNVFFASGSLHGNGNGSSTGDQDNSILVGILTKSQQQQT